MKSLLIAFLLTANLVYAQLTLPIATDSMVRKYHIGSYSYHEQFIGHKGYGAPLILTSDGGGAAFGDGDEGTMLVKVDQNGKEQWKAILPPKGDESESQSVAEDKYGNYYVFTLVYDNTKYRGGCERAVLFDKTGKVVWDKFIGSCQLINNPTVSYIKALDDGRIALRGHVVTTQPAEGKDPEYHYWEGWLDKTGKLTQKAGDVIDWKDVKWQDLFKPE